MSRYGAAGLSIPEFVSGHQADASPSTAPHMAIIPMADAGYVHPEGRLMGLGGSSLDAWKNCGGAPNGIGPEAWRERTKRLLGGPSAGWSMRSRNLNLAAWVLGT